TAAVAGLAHALGVEVPVAPATLSLPPPVEPNAVSGMHVLPETLESPSGRLTATGSTHGGGFDASPREAPPREQHTQVSLSVTSGGVRFALENAIPRRSRVVAIGAAVGVAAALAVGIGVTFYSRSSNEPAKSQLGAR